MFKLNRYTVAILAVITVFFGIAVYFYPRLPEIIASHWNAQGQANGYSSRFWGLFLMPVLSAALVLLLLFIPRLDPLRENIEKFKQTYQLFVLILLVFMLYLYVLNIFWNLGYTFDITQALIPAFAAFFYACGAFIQKIKRNNIAGIRTPWTLKNDGVWDKTHNFSGKLFKVTAIASLGGIFFPAVGFFFIIGPVLLASLVSVVYSYLVYKKQAF